MTPLLQKWVHQASVKQWEVAPGTTHKQVMGVEHLRYGNFIEACSSDERWERVIEGQYVFVGIFECTARVAIEDARSWEKQFDDTTYSIGIWGSTLGEVLDLAFDWFQQRTNDEVVAVFNKYSKTGIAYTAIHKPSKE